jgi:hypothetical protein
VGLCFGLGYGVSHRLLNLRIGEETGPSQRFDVQPFPGTSLESLRQRFGGEARDIRGDLDQIELEQQQKQDAAEIEKRRSELEKREAEERQRLFQEPEAPAESVRRSSPPTIEAEPAPAPPAPAPRTPPARERESAAPPPVAPPPAAPPPLTPPPSPEGQP